MWFYHFLFNNVSVYCPIKPIRQKHWTETGFCEIFMVFNKLKLKTNESIQMDIPCSKSEKKTTLLSRFFRDIEKKAFESLLLDVLYLAVKSISFCLFHALLEKRVRVKYNFQSCLLTWKLEHIGFVFRKSKRNMHFSNFAGKSL